MPHKRHHLRSAWRRGIYSFGILVFVLGFGTLGMHSLEKMSWLDSFYFISMIATAQGAATIPSTVGGKLFAACMAFVSVGSAVAALGFIFGPMLGQLWRVGVQHLEEEEKKLFGKHKPGA